MLLILWLALRSGRIILAVFLNLFVGLAMTAALGLMMVGALNLISVAFAVLFVGLGVDFGIQFASATGRSATRSTTCRPRWSSTAQKIGAPLTLAAAAVAAGFLSFLPTDYRGVSELGQIAGVGMLIAYRHQHHAAAGAADAPQAARRARGGRLSRARAGRPLPGAPPHRRWSAAPVWSRSPACRCCST